MDKIKYAVIGSGPASQFTLEGLLSSGVKLDDVIIFEAGGKSDLPKSSKRIDFKNLPIKTESRNIQFGGTSNTWSKLCSVFDENEIRLLKKGDNSWKDVYEQISPIYSELSKEYDFPIISVENKNLFGSDIAFRVRKFETISSTLKNEEIRRMFSRTKLFHKLLFFKKIDGKYVLYFQNLITKEEYNFSCENLVLACGGLENIRILLDSFKGTEKSYNVVGKYFTNHPKFRAGKVSFNNYQDVSQFIGFMEKGKSGYHGISLSSEELKSHLNHYVRLEPIYPWTDDFLTSKFINYMSFLKSFISRIFSRKILLLSMSELEKIKEPFNEGNEGINITPIFKYFLCRMGLTKPRTSDYYVRNYLEMQATWENNVTICKADKLPSNIIVDYKIGDREIKSFYALHTKLADCFNSIGAKYEFPSFDSIEQFSADASHHCGGTILGSSSKNSVVSANLELHDYKNCFVVGSSVFPSSGSVNPTFTIATLGLRLGRFLGTRKNAS